VGLLLAAVWVVAQMDPQEIADAAITVAITAVATSLVAALLAGVRALWQLPHAQRELRDQVTQLGKEVAREVGDLRVDLTEHMRQEEKLRQGQIEQHGKEFSELRESIRAVHQRVDQFFSPSTPLHGGQQ
jgi:hypothetical protein